MDNNNFNVPPVIARALEVYDICHQNVKLDGKRLLIHMTPYIEYFGLSREFFIEKPGGGWKFAELDSSTAERFGIPESDMKDYTFAEHQLYSDYRLYEKFVSIIDTIDKHFTHYMDDDDYIEFERERVMDAVCFGYGKPDEERLLICVPAFARLLNITNESLTARLVAAGWKIEKSKPGDANKHEIPISDVENWVFIEHSLFPDLDLYKKFASSIVK